MKARIPGAPEGGNNMMQMIQNMQENIKKIQQEVEETEFTSSVGGGAVEVTVNGAHEVTAVKLSNKLGSHPVSLSAEGYVSLEMEKVLNSMPGANQGVKAQMVLEINSNHPIAEKLMSADDETVVKYTKLLYNSARLIAGLDLKNPTEFSDAVVDLM